MRMGITRTGLRQMLDLEQQYHEELAKKKEALEDQIYLIEGQIATSQAKQRMLARALRQKAREEDS